MQPRNQSELACALRKLAAAKPADRQALAELEQRCISLTRYLGGSAPVQLSVPELVWHFLADPDIRFKDSRYAEAQLAELDALLEGWDRPGDA
jgi:hypothetical protein